jgi:uncharacterized protein (TIGR03067 family)
MFRTATTLVAILLAATGLAPALSEVAAREPNTPHGYTVDARELRDQLDGKWEVVELVRGDSASKILPDEDMTGTVQIEGNSFLFTIDSLGQEMERWEATISVDYSRAPGTIDLTFISGPIRGRTAAGIFEMNGDEMRIALPVRDAFDDRPTELSAPQGSNKAVFTLKRAKD